MLSVTMHRMENGRDREIGTISWDGNRFLFSNEDPSLRHVMDFPLWTRHPEGPELVRPEDGEAFLRALPYSYMGTYAWIEGPFETQTPAQSSTEPVVSYAGEMARNYRAR